MSPVALPWRAARECATCFRLQGFEEWNESLLRPCRAQARPGQHRPRHGGRDYCRPGPDPRVDAIEPAKPGTAVWTMLRQQNPVPAPNSSMAFAVFSFMLPFPGTSRRWPVRCRSIRRRRAYACPLKTGVPISRDSRLLRLPRCPRGEGRNPGPSCPRRGR